jgi:hypothetical protein
VIPEVQPLVPPPTIPSVPARVFPPATGLGALGELMPLFRLRPSVTVSEEYSDNFNLTEQDRKNNFRSTLSPGLLLTINSPLTQGTIRYNFAAAHDTADDEIEYFHSMLAQGTWQANPHWRLSLSDVFTRSDEPADSDRLGLRQDRRTFTANTLTIGSEYLIGTVATRQGYRWSIFADDDGQETTSHSLSLNASVPAGATNTLSGGYEYLTSKTSGSDTPTDGDSGTSTTGDSDIMGHQITAAFARRLSASMTAGVSTSYAVRDGTSDTDDIKYHLWSAALFGNYLLPGRFVVDASIGLTGLTPESDDTLGPHLFTATQISYQFARALVSLAFDRGFSETFSEGENFGVVRTEGVMVSFSYPFRPSMSLTANAFYRRNKFTDIGATTTSRRDDRSENWGGTVGFEWRVVRNVLLELTYRYDNYSTNGDDNYYENRVRVAIGLSF